MHWTWFVPGAAAMLFVSIAAAQSTVPPSSPVNGQAIFTSNCGACHGADGRGGERAPSIASRREVIKLSDADLIRTVTNGLGGNGMPAFGYLGDEKVHAVVAYLRTLQGFGASEKSTGDAVAGQKLFAGKAACQSCHMVDGRGGFVAEDLTGYGLGQSPEELKRAIVQPGRRPGQAEFVTVVMQTKQQYRGLVRAQDNFSLTLQTEDGEYRNLSRDRILRVEPSGSTLMPDNYGTTLSGKEIDDLVSYLLKAGVGKSSKKSDDDDE